MSRYKIYVGSYTAKSADQFGAGKGIYVCRFDGKDTIIPVWVSTDCMDPSFLLVKGDMLYAVEETRESTLLAYKILNSQLKKAASLPLQQKDTCHIQMTSDEKYISTANYGSGSLSLAALMPDGLFGALACTFVHHGSSVHPRQTAPRVHSTQNSPDGKYLLAADLGTDKITVYFRTEEGRLIEEPKMGVQVPAGRGPRHMAFSPDGARLFVVCEISSTLLIYPYDAHSGVGELLEERNLVPQGGGESSKAADIHFSPDGRHLYISVRGPDTIVMAPYFDGVLGNIKVFPAYGKSPRNFCITPDGKYLITANELPGNIAVMPRDAETGVLGRCTAAADIPRAVYVTAVMEG